MNSKKRILALLMCICMIFTLMPFSVFAENAENGNGGLLREQNPASVQVIRSRAMAGT